MPTVRMLTSLATHRHAWREGELVQASPREAEEWVPAGIAELVREERAETPERPERGMETASTRRTRRRQPRG